MKTYKFTLNTGYVGSEVEDTFEFDDDITEDELHKQWVEWVWNTIDGSYFMVIENEI